ncbi:MAG TPA: hypothetical protein VK151_02540 [Fluviicola sp.]|nr:hypothetical protein [Fluviicola sp.]
MFFFTDLADLGSEPYNGNYGMKSLSEFQVSSQFQSASTTINPRAYAVCNGRIAFVRAVDNDDDEFSNLLLTIVLKPDDQPGGNIPHVKYYLYKGIIASSILSPTKVDLPNGNHRRFLNMTNTASIPFLQRVQNDYAAYMALHPELVVGTPDQDWIGLGRTNGFGSDPTNIHKSLDNIFNNNWGTDVPPLPRVNEGELIGNFIPKGFDVTYGREGQFCFEILLDRIGVNALLPEAIGNQTGNFGPNFRVINTGSDTVDGEPAFNTTVKSEILRFMDPCAFYGAFANLGMPQLTIVTNGARTILNPPGPNPANSVYNNLLNAPGNGSDLLPISGSNIFSNRNTVYIDIRDKFNNPYDFTRDKTIEYSDPPTNLRIGFNGITTLEKSIDYLGEEVGPFSQSKHWPILTIKLDTSFDASLNPLPPLEDMRGFPLNINNALNYNTIDIAFPCPSKNIASSCLYINNIGIVSPQDAINTDREGILHLDDTQSVWSATFHLRSPNATNTANAIPIANYISMIHLHCYKDFYEDDIANVNAFPFEEDPYHPNGDMDYPQPMEIHPQNYCDFLWPIDLTLNWPGWNEDRIRSTIYSENIPVDNMAVTGSTFIGNLGIARDADPISTSPAGFVPKVTLFAYNTIPRNNSIGLIDREFDESTNAIFQFTGDSSYLSNIGSNIKEFTYDLKNPSIAGETGIFVDHLVKRTPAQIALLGIPSPFLTVDDFVYFTIAKSDYDAILVSWKAFLLANSNVERPIKAWWSFDPIKSEWDPRAEREFVRFQINIKYLNRAGSSSGSNTPARMKVYTPMNTGTSTPYFSEKFMDKIDLTTLTPRLIGSGFSILPYQGVDRIQCKINFIKGANITYDEFLTYKNYALHNIRQVWSNPEGQPTDPTGQGLPPSDYTNLGLTALVRSRQSPGATRAYPITAWDVTAQQGCSCSFDQIDAGEVVVIVERSKFTDGNDWDKMKRDRPFVVGSPTNILDGAGNVVGQTYTARIARFVYNAVLGTYNSTTAPYQDDNHAAHEFGHFLGLTDRYTYVANVDASNQIIDGTGRGINYYIPLWLDPDYGEDYRWLMNLMSIGARKVPALPLPTAYASMHAEFQNAISGFESPNNNQLSTGSRGNTFITPFQWDIIKSFATDNQEFENNRFKRTEFTLQDFVYFAPAGTDWNFNIGTFAGPSGLGIPISDHSFNDTNGAHKMLDRVNDTNPNTNGIPSAILGYFSPFLPNSGDPLLGISAANAPSEMFHIRLGDDANVFFAGAINGAMSNTNMPDLINVGSVSGNLRFNAVGTTDSLNVGATIWNTVLDRVVSSGNPTPAPPAANETIAYPNSTGRMYSHTFIVKAEYRNRLKIIQILVNGNA